MTAQPPTVGRRERNKLQKLERITAAASELFAERGVDEVTTQQIAEKADVGTGTLFLYAKTKGELLLLVQNRHYARALEQGAAAAQAEPDVVDAIMAILRAVIECNRVQVDNGRTYLREMVFASSDDARHAEALSIVAATELAVSSILQRDPAIDPERGATLARIVSAIMFLTLGAGANASVSVDALANQVRTQVDALLRG